MLCRISDVDECALSGAAAACQNGGTCTNVVGGFSCECSEFFSGLGAITCEAGEGRFLDLKLAILLL